MSTLLTSMVTAKPYEEKVQGYVQANCEDDLLTASARREREGETRLALPVRVKPELTNQGEVPKRLKGRDC